MVYRSISAAVCLALGLVLLAGFTGPVLADESEESLEGLPTLSQTEMEEFHSKRFKPKWHGVYVPEPKPSKVGKLPLPQFGGDTARPFDGSPGSAGSLPFSRLHSPSMETR